MKKQSRTFDINRYSIADWLRRSARYFSGKICLIVDEESTSYGELDQHVNRLANGLIDMGISKGDKVAFLYPNCRQLVECYFAIAKVGAVSVPLNMRLSPQHKNKTRRR